MTEHVKIKHSFAYYLPQFHEVKENNEWWGKGFTEWVNLDSAVKYKTNQKICHPHEDLGFYDLNDVTVISKQYKIAKSHNIDTFCFWHYWFSNDELLLEKPAELLLKSNEEVEFCFAWANHTWFNKSKGILLKKQTYDYSLTKHFNYLSPFFKDERYRKINNKPVFVIYDPLNCENLNDLQIYFNKRAQEIGFDGIFFIFENCKSAMPLSKKCDLNLNSNNFMNFRGTRRIIFDKCKSLLRRLNIKIPGFYDYSECVRSFNSNLDVNSNEIPIVFPGWDTTIRHKKGGICMLGNTPEKFGEHLSKVKDILAERNENNRYVFIKSWNEWAEGNYLEPSSEFGYAYLNQFKQYFKL